MSPLLSVCVSLVSYSTVIIGIILHFMRLAVFMYTHQGFKGADLFVCVCLRAYLHVCVCVCVCVCVREEVVCFLRALCLERAGQELCDLARRSVSFGSSPLFFYSPPLAWRRPSPQAPSQPLFPSLSYSIAFSLSPRKKHSEDETNGTRPCSSGGWGHNLNPSLCQIKSNQILFVTYTWLADVNASVAKCLCF
jgi:hypothetical protein